MKRSLKRSMWGPVLGLAALLTLGWSGGQARADILLNLGATSPSGSNTVYTYNVNLQPDSQLTSGGGLNTPPPANFFTINDFDGYVSASASTAGLTLGGSAPGSWLITDTNFTGRAAAGTGAPDSPGVINITFTYNSPPAPVINNNSTTTSLQLGFVTLTSSRTLDPNRILYYSGSTQDSQTGLREANNFNSVAGPTAIPEPGSLALTACLAFVFGGGALLRRRRSQA